MEAWAFLPEEATSCHSLLSQEDKLSLLPGTNVCICPMAPSRHFLLESPRNKKYLVERILELSVFHKIFMHACVNNMKLQNLISNFVGLVLVVMC